MKMEYFLIWIGLCIVVGVAAQSRRNRNGFGWFLLSLLITPLLAGLLVLAMPSYVPRMTRREMVARIEELKAIEAAKVHPGWKDLRA
jgi:uncharacterized membrane-anchored protein